MNKVSIIVPVYNSEAYLEKCLDSIRRQTLQDFECILVDDGSTDSSGKISDRYASIDERFIVLHKENGGVSSARNVGLKRATGEYIGFVDSDDWIEDNMYETLYSDALETGCDIVICGCTPFNKGQKNRVLTSHEAEMIMFDQRETIGGYSWLRLIRRETVSGVFYDEKLKCYEDLVFFYKLFKKTDKIYWHDLPLYHYEARVGSAINSYHVDDKKKEGIEALRKCAEMEEKADLRERINSFIYFWYLEAAINYVSHRNVHSSDFTELYNEVKKTGRYMSGATLRQRLWRHIILSKKLRCIYWTLKKVKTEAGDN